MSTGGDAPGARNAAAGPASDRVLAVPRTARVVVLGGEAAPHAVVGLHGYGQRADLFARHLAPFASASRRVVVPEALSRFYLDMPAADVVRTPGWRPRVGASWMTREAREAEIADLIGYLDAATDAFVAPGAEVSGLGFSQGAAALCRWAARGKRPLARLVLWGGAVPDDVLSALEAGTLALPPVTLVCGDVDAYVSPATFAAHAARLRDLGVAVRAVAFAGGHRLNAATLSAVLDSN